MGFLAGDGEDDTSNDLADEQIRNNQAELENKRQNLFRERLEVIKGQGGQSFRPNRKGVNSIGGNR